MAHAIDGRALAKTIRDRVKNAVDASGITPKLAVMLVGDDPASHLYVSLKEKAAGSVGIAIEKQLFSEGTTTDDLCAAIATWNMREDIHAILVQLPLPDGYDTDRVIGALAPEKDVDGFHPKSIDAFLHEKDALPPILVEGIIALLESTGLTLAGRNAVVLANSETFALPLAHALEGRDFTSTILVEVTQEEIDDLLPEANIVVTALGKPGAVHGSIVRDDAILIDVGTTGIPGDGVKGDVRAEDFSSRDNVWLTPVPGGVGPVTVAMVLQRTAILAGVKVG